MKKQHDGDCSVYACLGNKTPEAGICTCGYGHQLLRQGNPLEMYSEELQEKLEAENSNPVSLEEITEIMEGGGWKR